MSSWMDLNLKLTPKDPSRRAFSRPLDSCMILLLYPDIFQSLSVSVFLRRKWALSPAHLTCWRTWSPSPPIPSSWLQRASTEWARTPTKCQSTRRKHVGPIWGQKIFPVCVRACVWSRPKSLFGNAKVTLKLKNSIKYLLSRIKFM